MIKEGGIISSKYLCNTYHMASHATGLFVCVWVFVYVSLIAILLFPLYSKEIKYNYPSLMQSWVQTQEDDSLDVILCAIKHCPLSNAIKENVFKRI